MSACSVRQLDVVSSREFAGLCEVLIDCVAGGASVSFMQPMTLARAAEFWREIAASTARGERALIVAEDAAGAVVGTVQVVWATAENQPHRADVSKMLVKSSARNGGVGAALLGAAERAAAAAGKTLLVLDTANDAAERLYTRGGWQRVGVIPDFALWPQGGLCPTTIFYKQLRH